MKKKEQLADTKRGFYSVYSENKKLKGVKIVNHEQNYTLSKAITIVNNLDLSPMDKCFLNCILSCYQWLSEYFNIDATYQDVIELFLEGTGFVFDEDTKELLSSLD